jgi:ssDNA-binding Zn-finger/Zn-ribbon topoisomerase 1
MTWWVYFAVLESSEWQATLGKMVCGLIVVDEYDNRISFARATGRYFAQILSALILGIGFIMVAFTRRKQGLHDLLAGTLVTRKQAASSTQYTGNRGFPAHATSEDTKKCPACAETIKREAKKCRVCGEVLDPNLRMRNNDTQFNLFQTCPKCNYERQPKDEDFTPKTECPQCGVIYEKFLES